MTAEKKKVRMLTEGALVAAMALVLSYVDIPIGLQYGGSIDFVMVPIIIYSVRWGSWLRIYIRVVLWYAQVLFIRRSCGELAVHASRLFFGLYDGGPGRSDKEQAIACMAKFADRLRWQIYHTFYKRSYYLCLLYAYVFYGHEDA